MKRQKGLRLDIDVIEKGLRIASKRKLTFTSYVEQLILADKE